MFQMILFGNFSILTPCVQLGLCNLNISIYIIFSAIYSDIRLVIKPKKLIAFTNVWTCVLSSWTILGKTLSHFFPIFLIFPKPFFRKIVKKWEKFIPKIVYDLICLQSYPLSFETVFLCTFNINNFFILFIGSENDEPCSKKMKIGLCMCVCVIPCIFLSLLFVDLQMPKMMISWQSFAKSKKKSQRIRLTSRKSSRCCQKRILGLLVSSHWIHYLNWKNSNDICWGHDSRGSW